MTTEEYLEKKRSIEIQCEKDKNQLAEEYALSNNPYEIGDVFTDHIGSIKIEKIMTSTGGLSTLPTCVYRGLELKKDGTPKKIPTQRVAWLTNEVKNDKN